MALTPRRGGVFRILLIEQEPHIIDELRDIFTSREFEFEVALELETAREVLAERRMDAIIIDAAVESVENAEVPNLIQELKRGDAEMKVVVFNGVTDKAKQRRMRRLGADGYLSTKSDLRALERSVHRVLDLR